MEVGLTFDKPESGECRFCGSVDVRSVRNERKDDSVIVICALCAGKLGGLLQFVLRGGFSWTMTAERDRVWKKKQAAIREANGEPPLVERLIYDPRAKKEG